MRPAQWTKNLFVLVALPFSGQWSAVDGLSSLGTCAAFCLLSSCVYLINDLADRASDRLHPTKRFRPIASGELSVGLAIAAALVLLLASAAIIALIGYWLIHTANQSFVLERDEIPGYVAARLLAFWSASYFMLNLAYSLRLKQYAIMDVLIIATCFVLRAMAGAAAIAVIISPWLVVCTFTLCLFIALAKRRSEIAMLGDAAQSTRRANGFYTLVNIEHMLAVSAGLAIVTYTLYCLAQRTIARHSANLVWTIPLVIYGMFRYYCLALSADSQDVAKLLSRDKVMWLVVFLWMLAVVVVIRWGGSPLFKGILQ